MLPLRDRRFQEYSTGNKQRLGIIRALIPDPQVLLLDEPTRSLDPISADALRKLIMGWVRDSRHKTVLITSHNLNEVEETCDRVAILSRHRLVDCSALAELKEKYHRPAMVSLKVRTVDSTPDLAPLCAALPGLTSESIENNIFRLTFPNRNGENSLNFVLSHLVREGIEILQCDTDHQDLRGIMVEIERTAEK